MMHLTLRDITSAWGCLARVPLAQGDHLGLQGGHLGLQGGLPAFWASSALLSDISRDSRRHPLQ